jgi:hypothetical protein
MLFDALVALVFCDGSYRGLERDDRGVGTGRTALK